MRTHFPADPAYTFSDNPNETQLARIKTLLDQSYWASGRPIEVIERSIQNSIIFNIFHNSVQIGFARVITDSITFGYVCDVIIDPDHRAKGLGKWLVGLIVDHERVRDCQKLMLKTRDAHELYRTVGFHLAIQPESIMERNHD